jgi:N-glycosylase/DNA lyase
MYTIFNEDFNLDITLDCGQVFRWSYIDGWWVGVVSDTFSRLRQDSRTGEVTVDSTLPPEFFESYFRFDDDLEHILNEINKDEFMNEAINKYWGLRLIRQDPWECLISYMLATAWNIPNIKRGISNICERYGRELNFGFYAFPDAQSLANACDEDILECKLGFRGSRIVDAAVEVGIGAFDLDELFEMDYSSAKNKLMELNGIGEKVADCILLFAYGKMEAFPVDTHVEQVVKNVYGDHEFFSGNATKSKIGNWGREYFGEYCGYAQQYFFYQKRMEGL